MPTTGVTVVVASLPHDSGLPGDVMQNVFCFNNNGVYEAFQEYYGAVVNFYNGIPTGDTIPVGEWLSDSISRAADACKVQVYVQDDPSGALPMGSPVYEDTFTLTPENNQAPYPEEITTCLTYHADLAGVPQEAVNPTPPPLIIRPASRRRGRLYIGPVNVTVGSVTNDVVRPNLAWRNRCTRALKTLHDTSVGWGDDQYFGVWSREDAVVYNPVSCYMDDAWDIQRRRGIKPTTRTTLAL